MEQHPIPQDVTGFQFKLIGTMTVKQFGYVAAGVILAVICYYAPTPGFWFILTKFILLPLFGLTGVIIAFVPIEGRPIDVMATNFVHALVSPNQYIYIKKGKRFSFTQIRYTKMTTGSQTDTTYQPRPKAESKKEQQLQALLSGRYGNIKNNLDKKEMAFFKTIENASGAIAAPLLQATQEKKVIAHTTIPNTPIQIPEPQPLSPQGIFLQKQIQNAHSQKEQAEQELLKLKDQLSAQKPALTPVVASPASLPMPHLDTTHVHNIPQGMTKNAGLSYISDTPNVIVGIVKDARGNILSNILVEVKDKDGNPVRAFKTNPLGQFASATPLANGIYTIELEDPKKQHAFDIIQINAAGQIMLPIEVISHDAREELRKALFN